MRPVSAEGFGNGVFPTWSPVERRVDEVFEALMIDEGIQSPARSRMTNQKYTAAVPISCHLAEESRHRREDIFVTLAVGVRRTDKLAALADQSGDWGAVPIAVIAFA
jgi:hypothetical protein